MTSLIKQEPFSLEPRNFAEAERYANLIATSDFAPKEFRNKPGNVLIAVQYGAELGLKPLQAVNGIAVVNGRPTVWGDALLAVCQGHPDFEDIGEKIDGTDDTRAAVCTVHRRGRSPIERRFSVADAKKAKLWGNNVWATYPDRMLQMRARGFALRDAFADALRGVISTEEARDIPVERHMGEVQVMPPKPSRTEQVKQLLTKEPEVVDAVTGEVQPGHADALAQLITERSASLMAADDEASLREIVADLGGGMGGKYSKDELAPLAALFRARLQQVKGAQLGMEPGAQG